MNYDYDVVVIGAGIHGAGVAQAAAAAGHSVLVLEQYSEPAQATSSKSSKLVHGGLRYLESGEFKLVYECLRERRYLVRNAPHLARLAHFYIPVYKQTTRSPWLIALGLLLYSLFSGKRFRRLKRKHWHELEDLKTQDLKAVFSYLDGQTDDARLTRSVLASAEEHGASIEYCARFESAVLVDQGCELEYIKQDITGDTRTRLTTRVIVNATNAWANDVLATIQPSPSAMAVDLVQGAHIIVPGHARNYYYLESPTDRRAVFVVPWKDHILIGTTENVYQGDPAFVQPLTEEVNYLLDVYNHYFNKNLVRDDVVDVFAGLRVLPAGNDAAFGRSRDTSIKCDRSKAPRVVTLYGGKLTSYRSTAEKVLKSILSSLPPKKLKQGTHKIKLPLVD